MTTNTAPDLSQPLVHDPVQEAPAANIDALGPLKNLLGTWTNQDIGGSGKGGTTNPFSYDLMVLPEKVNPDGYILKNFTYYEEITFSAIHGTAPNRGGEGTQVANTIFYEQRVYFADGPAKDSLVHAENGSWLFLTDQEQLLGPYGDGNGPNVGTTTVPNGVVPTQQYSVVKQMSVPHGNSILALGNVTEHTGVPTIAAPPQILPEGDINTSQYDTESVGNPIPELNKNPNKQLSDALEVANPNKYIEMFVDSKNGGHPVTNIGFEQQHAKVSSYFAHYWIEALGASADFTQLQYTQTIMLDIPIEGKGTVTFPHITCNTLTKKP